MCVCANGKTNASHATPCSQRREFVVQPLRRQSRAKKWRRGERVGERAARRITTLRTVFQSPHLCECVRVSECWWAGDSNAARAHYIRSFCALKRKKKKSAQKTACARRRGAEKRYTKEKKQKTEENTIRHENEGTFTRPQYRICRQPSSFFWAAFPRKKLQNWVLQLKRRSTILGSRLQRKYGLPAYTYWLVRERVTSPSELLR